MYYKVSLISIIGVLTFFACNQSYKNNVYFDIRQILESDIDLSQNIIGTDGSIFQKKYENTDLQIIHYIDSAECNECSMKSLHYWRSTLEDTTFSKVGFFFIVWSDSYQNTQRALHNINFKYPVYMDLNGCFGNRNIFLKNKLYNTVLVNKENKIILVGDFHGNNKLEALYRKLIEENE